MSEQLTVYNTDKGEMKLSPAIVKKYLVSGNGQVSDQEVAMFIALCKYQNLNPFLREAYLIKFGSSPATIVTGKEVFTKRESQIKECAGWEAGITVIKNNEIVRRTGTLVLKGEELVGGWCKVYRHDWKVPIDVEVSMSEFDKKQSSWKTMPATMIRKVAVVTGLREAFPTDFQGMYDSAEMPVDSIKLEDRPINIVDTEKQEEIIEQTIEENLRKSEEALEE
jgi:phage recombination protein Bet